MVLKLIAALAIALLLSLAADYFLYSRVQHYKAELAAASKEITRLQDLVAQQAAIIDANTKAAVEQALRYKETTEDHDAFKAEIQVCDIQPDWVVPPSLYERLCRPAPSP